MARVGAILAPTLAFLNTHWSASVYMTVVVLGTINLIASYFFLVETKGVVLDKVHIPDNDEAEGQAKLPEADPMLSTNRSAKA